MSNNALNAQTVNPETKSNNHQIASSSGLNQLEKAQMPTVTGDKTIIKNEGVFDAAAPENSQTNCKANQNSTKSEPATSEDRIAHRNILADLTPADDDVMVGDDI
ncbi:hypothetical protein ACH5RR_029842 [Cinchona calisaya]|uniref:Uncharacterized protein n=1 Tax=Cinchona calisaya TaxID=153742 RepID=A0ABD2YST7_9GENT